MPWQSESTKGDEAREHFKYQYHPGGDPRNPPKDAPSALHSVIVPNVTLPKVCHILLSIWNGDQGDAVWLGRQTALNCLLIKTIGVT